MIRASSTLAAAFSPGSVFNDIPFRVNDRIDEAGMADTIRALFKSGNFDDVQVGRDGEVLVTGAAGGVGSVAVAVLAKLGWRTTMVVGILGHAAERLVHAMRVGGDDADAAGQGRQRTLARLIEEAFSLKPLLQLLEGLRRGMAIVRIRRPLGIPSAA